MQLESLKIAIVADWLTNFAGAEQVILSLTKLFPHADLFTSVYNPKKMPQFKDKEIQTTFLQKLPYIRNKHQMLLKWMPLAFETLDLSEYDIVISSSHACSKGVITKPNTLHVCYCHTPLRAAWDSCHEYIKKYTVNRLIKKFVPYLMKDIRIWDRLAAERVDYFIANSAFVQNRIKKYYRRQSTVIYPPVDTEKFEDTSTIDKKYFLAVGRIVPNKNMDLLVNAFNQVTDEIRIIGSGIDLKKLKKRSHKNIKFLGKVSDEVLKKSYAECTAFIMPQIEDFGIAPVEAMAAGKPVIAFRGGGALESVHEHKTGIFFDEQTPESLIAALSTFKKMDFKPEMIQKHAQKFNEERFHKEITAFIQEKYRQWQKFMK